MLKTNWKRSKEKEIAPGLDWEEKCIMSDEHKDEMETMWEIPQIFHFLQLTKEVLSIPQLSMYEMERMLLMPKASKQLANIMTCLLSSPNLKSKLHKIPPMPYEFWTNILLHKVRSWFKIYQNKHKNAIKVFEAIGVESEFWNILPDISYIETKDFGELTLKQRVWLLKTVCDTIMHNRKTVQEELTKQPWENKIETILGIDRNGVRYIYFPQFLENDLRVYRHCLDNEILSTVKPSIIKDELKWEVKEEDAVKSSAPHAGRNKRRKSRWRNGSLPYKAKKRKEREKKKNVVDSENFVYSSDDVVNLLTNVNINLSETSNNNRINCDTINLKRCRVVSKTLEESSGNPRCSFVETNEYETNNSNETKSLETETFEGFKNNCTEESNNLAIIYDILDELTSKIEKSLDALEENNPNINSNKQEKLKKAFYCGESSSENEGLNDTILSNVNPATYIFEKSSKCKKKTSGNLKNRNKFENKKRFETNFSEKLDKGVDKDLQNDEIGLDKWLDALSKKKESEIKEEISVKDNELTCNVEVDYESSLIELRDVLINQGSADKFNWCGGINNKKNIKNIEELDGESEISTVDDFNGMMTELSISRFQLVADSVETLRNFIDDFFSQKDGLSVNNKNEKILRPICEEHLLRKMSNLLKSVESVELALKASTKNARSKLQKEWLDFKNGVVEDQDSSGDCGLTSNWWVIGSQLPHSSEATIQTISHSALSPSSSQNQAEHSDTEYDKRPEFQKRKGKSKFNDEEAYSERRKKSQKCDKNKDEEHEETEGSGSESEESKHQPKRVLRARGISSYTEQFYSDNSETEELERWTDLEAVYSAPSVQTNASSPNPPPPSRKPEKRSDTEDSDQDWILPSSRKRRSKRPSASRRLKSFQHKLQNIQTNSSISPLSNPSLAEVMDEKSDISRSNESANKEAPQLNNSEIQNTTALSTTDVLRAPKKKNPKKTASSTNAVCKIECADSVHSELDIKDEGPIVDTEANNYNVNMQQNYVVVKTEPAPMANYYVMQPNPPISGSVQQGPFIQQTTFVQSGLSQAQQVQHIPSGYYVQNTPNYMVQGPHSGFGSPRQPIGPQPPQQMVIQQPPQMIGTQQAIPSQNYVQYMVNTPQQGTVNPSLPHPRMMAPNVHRPTYMSNHMQPRGQVMNQHIRMVSRYPQNRMVMPRQNVPHPNGAVIRSMPIAGNGTRFSGVRNITPRNVVPRQNARAVAPRMQRLPKPSNTSSTPVSQNTTSLIVLSDSDDEIEMIITEKTNTEANPAPSASSPRKSAGQPIQRQKPIVTSEVTVTNPKSTLPPQIVQRMSQGGISITPVKNNPPPTNPNTQLVVVVNETGSHYALALPNGSKLILTPEQVAQIRASNGGKLIL